MSYDNLRVPTSGTEVHGGYATAEAFISHHEWFSSAGACVVVRARGLVVIPREESNLVKPLKTFALPSLLGILRSGGVWEGGVMNTC